MTYKELEELWRNLRYAASSEWICSISNRLDAAREEGVEQMRLKIVKEAFGAENEEFVSVPMSLLTPIPETPEEYYLMCEKAGLSPAPKELT